MMADAEDHAGKDGIMLIITMSLVMGLYAAKMKNLNNKNVKNLKKRKNIPAVLVLQVQILAKIDVNKLRY